MAGMHFYEQMSDEELLAELHSQRYEFFEYLEEIGKFPPFDEAEELARGEDVAEWSDLIVRIESEAKKRGLKHD